MVQAVQKTKETIEQKRERFLKALEETSGFFYMAVHRSKITPEEIEDIFDPLELQEIGDQWALMRDEIAENSLMELVESGEPSAVIFYCSTRLKGRGYKK